jgi:hypothetical protein
MRNRVLSLLSFAVAASLAGNALAQNDDCTGALSVVNGANGPFTNVGATTSAPAWPCASGGNDIWFAYQAAAAGSLTVDTCGGSYDSAIELFDGNLGCGSLASLICNDDSCGLQSSATVNVNQGDTIYIRVGGYAGATGTFTLNVNGPLGAGTTATATNYGAGCVAKMASVYEHFTTTASIDLSNTAFQLLNTGTGYLGLPSTAAFVAPSATATNLGLADDSETTITLSAPLAYPGGTTTTLNVCSNGHISTASNGAQYDYTPTATELLNWPNATWAVWHDMIPTATGADNVWFEEVAGVACVTWLNVVGYDGMNSGVTPSTFQLQFNLATGSVDFVFQSLDTVSVSGWTGGDGWIVGYTPAGASLDPGSVDLTMAVPGSIMLSLTDLPALALTSANRPIVGNTINLNTSNLGASAAFGAVMLGLSNPALDLTPLGMAGCTQYTDNFVTLLFLPFGAPTMSTPMTVPNAVGLTIYAQSFAYDPSANLTQLGAIASNGVALFVGDQ